MKLIICLVMFAIAFMVGILVMIHGWGLEPHSWPWIILGGLVSILIGSVAQVISSIDE